MVQTCVCVHKRAAVAADVYVAVSEVAAVAAAAAAAAAVAAAAAHW